MNRNPIRACKWRLAVFLLPAIVMAAPPGGVSPGVGAGRGVGRPGIVGVSPHYSPYVVNGAVPGRGISSAPFPPATVGHFGAGGYIPGSAERVPGSGYAGHYGNSGFYPSTGFYPGRGSGGRGFRGRLPWTYFLSPYYYPLVDSGDAYSPDYGQYGSPDMGPGGVSPDAQMLGNQVGEQLNDLSAQISDLRQAQQSGAASAPPNPPARDSDVTTPPITVVLKSGQKYQVQNYALFDGVLWDFSKATPRRISVDDIDLAASSKATEEHGGAFPDVSGEADDQ